MQKPLIDVLHDLEQEMLRLGYSKVSMRFYRTRWRKLLKFAKEQNENLGVLTKLCQFE